MEEKRMRKENEVFKEIRKGNGYDVNYLEKGDNVKI